MPGTRQWCFGPFRLDPTTESLWRDGVLLPLPPKPLAVLAYLVEHAGQVVAKETLLEAVWLNTAVTEGVLKTCLGQIRQVLGETARTPQYIATLYRRGYRFVAPVVEYTEAVPASTAVPPVETPALPQPPEVTARPPALAPRRPNVVTSPCSAAIWWTRRRWRDAWIWKSTARSYAPITRPVPR